MMKVGVKRVVIVDNRNSLKTTYSSGREGKCQFILMKGMKNYSYHVATRATQYHIAKRLMGRTGHARYAHASAR